MNPGASLAFYALLLILPISALIARRLPIRQWVPMALAWVTIFAIGWLIVRNFT